MRNLMRVSVRAGLALGSLFFFVANGSAQARPASANEKNYERVIYSVKGSDLYRAHCAPCHGSEGRGDGPVGPSLTVRPADLTVLSKKGGGRFPADRIRKIIDGEAPTLVSHGTREMPVWGPIFHKIEDDQDFGNVRIQNLVKYLEGIQSK